MYISFNKLAIDPLTTDTIGLAFMVNNTNGLWRIWPDSADRAVPSQWAHAILRDPATSIDPEAGIQHLRLYPNPGSQRLGIIYEGAALLNGIQLFDISGKPVYSLRLPDVSHKLQQEIALDLAAGVPAARGRS